MPVYDDQKKDTDAFDDIARRTELEDLEHSYAQPAYTGKRTYKDTPSPQALESAESQQGNAVERTDDQLGAGYTSEDEPQPRKKFTDTIKGWFRGGWRKKTMLFSAIGSVLTAFAVTLSSIFNFLNTFPLDHLLSNIEWKGFVRYEAKLEGRTTAWWAAYLTLRLAEVEDPNLKPADRDNFLFRANEVATGNLFYDWYATMRATEFEADLLEKEGIKFGSIACRGELVGNECKKGGNLTRFRPVIVTIKDEQIKFELTQAEIRAIENGDINGLNNRLRQFVEVQVLEDDKAGRKAVKEAVNRHTKPYQLIKRYYLRKSIQNMTGIRDWRFFEKTVNNLTGEKLRGTVNKVIAKALPESTKGGKWAQCVLGISECKTTTDPSDPANKATLDPLPAESCSTTPDNPACNTGKVDENGNPVTNDGSFGESVTEGLAGDSGPGGIANKILIKILEKANLATGIVSLLDTLKTVHNLIANGTLTNIIYMARATQAIGLFTTAGIMRDQIRSGEVTSEEVNVAMAMMTENAGSSEAWQTLIANNDPSVVSAAEMKASETKEEYCSPKHQELMLLPQNRQTAVNEYHWICDHERIGGPSLAKDITDGYNKSVGYIVGPIVAAYEGSGLSTIVGWINSAVDAVVGPIVQAATEGILGALGLKDDFKNLMGWVSTKVLTVLGAGPRFSENSPPGVLANHMFMGAAAAAEAAMRGMGAAATTEETRALATQATLAFEQERDASASFSQKYFSLTNPTSMAARSLFAVTNQSLTQTISSVFAGIFNAPLRLFGGSVGAATTTGYEAAKLAGVYTYDFPKECERPPGTFTLDTATNADELGLIPEEDLTWDLLRNHDEFNLRLRQDSPKDDVVQSVYNCELREVAMAGGTSGLYTNKFLGPNAYGAGFNSPESTVTGSIPTGTAQELAKQILEHDNISFQLPEQHEAMEHIAKTGKGRDCSAPSVSPTLLGVILALAEKYKLVVGQLVDDHVCNDGYHPKGMAVDINGVNPLSGSGGTGTNIRFEKEEQPILKRFYEDAGPLLSQLGGGTLQQTQCFSSDNKPKESPNVKYPSVDKCNHIHLDVGK